MKRATVKRIRFIPGMLVLYFAVLLLNVHAQDSYVTLPNGKQIIANKNTPLSYTYSTENGKLKSLKVDDPQEVVKVIVTLKDKPLALYMKKNILQKISLTSVKSSLQTVHSSVKSKISTIAQQLSAKTNFQYQYKVRHEYYTAINGMALECNRGMMSYIRSLPEVENVQLDGQVKADLTQSVHQIRADIVQDSLGYTGDGVLIGEVDTGIDYMNPALGGGFGPGYRVIGGYDFANGDNDPMDDHGHGTHVAGIIGADGGKDLTGVAPKVKFLAVKVLDKNGMGEFSDVIAGIEYCLDPDGNPATDDGVDIINMSLGGQAKYNSPAELAIENATQAGILSVVAAGNSGVTLPYDPLGGPYQTISSPGTAPTALTVGACDINDNIASFSSKGPDPIHLGMKPEVVAPGVGILSTILNNQTASWSGTSMATPHVTGVAALLKQQHSDWTPEQLKAAIVNSAKSINESPYIAGNGRVDALNAAKLGMLVEPGVLNYGLDDLSQAVWKDTVQFKVKNIRKTSQNVNLELQNNFPSGVEVNLSQTDFSLSPMQEITVTAIVSVPSSVPINNTAPYAYTNNIICRSDSDTVMIPMGFIKSNLTIIDCDAQPKYLYFYQTTAPPSLFISPTDGVNKYTVTIPAGTYNFLAIELDQSTIPYKHYTILRKNINTAGLNYITLNHTEALFSAFNNLDGIRDINNNPVSGIDTSSCNLVINVDRSFPTFHSTALMIYPLFTPQISQFFFSPMEDTLVSVEQGLSSFQGDQVLSLWRLSKNIKAQSDLTFFSGSQNLTDIYFKFNYENAAPPASIIPCVSSNFWSCDEFGNYYVVTVGNNLPNLHFVHVMANKNPGAFNPMSYHSRLAEIGKYPGSGWNFHIPPDMASTSEFRINENGEFVSFERKPDRPDVSEYFDVQNFLSGDTVCVEEQDNVGVQLPVFQFELRGTELRLSQTSTKGFNVYTDGGITSTDGMQEMVFANSGSVLRRFTAHMFTHNCPLQNATPYHYPYYEYAVNMNTDRYRLIAATPQYNLLGQKGQTTINYEFNVTNPTFLGMTGFALPSLDLFQTLADGKLAQWLHPGQDGKVRLVLFDPKKNVDSVSIYLLLNDGTEISMATTHPSTKEYFATIPKDIPDGFMDVIARVHDIDGNTFTLTVSPAFYYGASMGNVKFDSRLLMSTYALENPDAVKFNVGDTLRYTLTYTNYGNNTAKNISISLPQTGDFSPIGNTTITIDSLQSGDTCNVPLILLYLGKKQPNDIKGYYTSSITWNSNGKLFTRNHSILVDYTGTTTNITEIENTIPKEYSLSQNYPNPFNPATIINYQLRAAGKVSLKVYDMLGREIATLVDEIKSAGSYSVQWNAQGMSSGVYFYRLQAGTFSATKKLVLLK